jgi:hypothetical protein
MFYVLTFVFGVSVGVLIIALIVGGASGEK